MWIDARGHSFDMMADLAESVYSVVTRDHFVPPRPMARLCKELRNRIVPQILGGIDGNTFVEALLDKCAEAISAARSLLDSKGGESIYRMGCWPQFIAIIMFAGELFKVGLLEKEVLMNQYMKGLLCDTDLSDLKIEGFCAMLGVVGPILDEGTTRNDINRYFHDLSEYRFIRHVPVELTQLLDELQVLRSNDWIRIHEQEERTHGLDSLRNSPPYNFCPPNYSDCGTPESSSTRAEAATDFDNVWSMPRHDQFYLSDGNILIVCEETLFRVHMDLLRLNSPIFREKLSPQNLARAGQVRGYPCLHLPDSKGDFSILLKVIYTIGFPTRHKTPDFATFSSILRMATRYQIPSIREQILEDLDAAYPTKFIVYECSKVHGEDVFGEPLPHPNAVLNLFNECDVKFALPFAFYRACRAGLASLTASSANVALPPSVLRVTIRGLGELKEAELNAAKTMLFGPKLQTCERRTCYRKTSLYTAKNGSNIFQSIFDSVTCASADMAAKALEPPPFASPTFKTTLCDACISGLSDSHRESRVNVWNSLPAFFEPLAEEK